MKQVLIGLLVLAAAALLLSGCDGCSSDDDFCPIPAISAGEVVGAP